MADPSPSITRIAADIGGTFTDLAVLTPEGRLATRKLPSTPANYADAVIAGIEALMAELGAPLGALEAVLHGCTVATNAILEHKGARTALLTTKGFRDVLELRRIRVPSCTTRSTRSRRPWCRGGCVSRSRSASTRRAMCSSL